MHFQVKGTILTRLYMDNNAKQKDMNHMIDSLSLKPRKGRKKQRIADPTKYFPYLSYGYLLLVCLPVMLSEYSVTENRSGVL